MQNLLRNYPFRKIKEKKITTRKLREVKGINFPSIIVCHVYNNEAFGSKLTYQVTALYNNQYKISTNEINHFETVLILINDNQII